LTHNYLVSRGGDFWILGGASLLVYAMMLVATGFRSWYGVGNHLGNLAVTMATLSLLVNYPHFLASYRLAYGRGRAFMLRHWLQTLLVPAGLLFFLTYTYWLTNQPESKELCEQLLGVGINFMFFTVGWHYSKQAFGCVMVYAAYAGYPLDARQREVIRWSLLSVWWYNFAHGGLNREGVFWSLRYTTWLLPDGVYLLSFGFFLSLVGAVVYGVLIRNWQRGFRPHPTMWVPYVAMLVWFAPCFRQPDAYFYVVPFFHSLQYLAFVYRVENARPTMTAARASALALGLGLSGWLAFEGVPGNLDQSCNAMNTLGFSFWLIAFNLFLNIHHYFLDNVLWRVRDDPQVRQALFDSA
jgi:hypothetical protein